MKMWFKLYWLIPYQKTQTSVAYPPLRQPQLIDNTISEFTNVNSQSLSQFYFTLRDLIKCFLFN